MITNYPEIIPINLNGRPENGEKSDQKLTGFRDKFTQLTSRIELIDGIIEFNLIGICKFKIKVKRKKPP